MEFVQHGKYYLESSPDGRYTVTKCEVVKDLWRYCAFRVTGADGMGVQLGKKSYKTAEGAKAACARDAEELDGLFRNAA